MTADLIIQELSDSIISVPNIYLKALRDWIAEIIYEADDPDQPTYIRLQTNIENGQITIDDFLGLREYSFQTTEFAENINDELLQSLMEELRPFFQEFSPKHLPGRR